MSHLVARDSAARHHERLGGKAKMEILEVDLFLARLLAKCWGVLSHAEINGGFVAVGELGGWNHNEPFKQTVGAVTVHAFAWPAPSPPAA